VTPRSADTRLPEAERRQLTVLFCDLVDSTALASQLDPEEWRKVVRAYQATCATVIGRFEGHLARYLGDGVLVYFGYPQRYEDDAQRAVRAGLGMVEAVGQLNTGLAQEQGVPLAVRPGIRTGQAVVGEIRVGRIRNSTPSARQPMSPPACKGSPRPIPWWSVLRPLTASRAASTARIAVHRPSKAWPAVPWRSEQAATSRPSHCTGVFFAAGPRAYCFQ
jgi:Adenylate and Guanylate cyclase catalytic domain